MYSVVFSHMALVTRSCLLFGVVMLRLCTVNVQLWNELNAEPEWRQEK